MSYVTDEINRRYSKQYNMWVYDIRVIDNESKLYDIHAVNISENLIGQPTIETFEPYYLIALRELME